MRMKKLLSVLLVAAMLASMAVTAFAEGETTVPAGDAGIALTAEPTQENGSFSIREGNDYQAAYEAAGITFENGTLTINKATFEAFVAQDSEQKTLMTRDGKLYVGLEFSVPSNDISQYKKFQLADTREVDLTKDVDQQYGLDVYTDSSNNKHVVVYINVTKDENGTIRDPLTNKEFVGSWKGENGAVKVTSTYTLNVEIDETVPGPTPDPDPNPDTDSGSSGSGSSSSDSSSGSSSAAAPSANVDSKGAVSAVKVNSDAKKAVSNAKNGTANVNVTNAKTVDSAALNAMAKTAAKEDVALTMTAKTTDRNGSVVATLKFDTAEAAKAVAAAEVKEVKLGVELNTKNTKNVTSLFKKWFKNKNIVTVKMAQKGEFGFNVAAAVKVDLKKFNKDTLHFYSYDAATNTYKEINTKYTIDAKGLVHFNTTVGNYIIITDAPIASK